MRPLANIAAVIKSPRTSETTVKTRVTHLFSNSGCGTERRPSCWPTNADLLNPVNSPQPLAENQPSDNPHGADWRRPVST
jgi:hypothetical protein